MKTMDLTEEELIYFKLLCNRSWESIIYYKNDLIYKIFKRNCDYYIGANYSSSQIQEKLNKIELLGQVDLPDTFIKPLDFIRINDQNRGYTMPYIHGKTMDLLYYLPNETKLVILKQIKKIIEEAHRNNIILSDISLQNFLIQNDFKGIKTFVCDLDNAAIKDKKYDVINEVIGGKYLEYHKFDKTLDYFEFNLLILAFIGNVNPYLVFNEEEMERTIFGKDKEYYSLYKYIMDYPNQEQEIILNEIEKKYIR